MTETCRCCSEGVQPCPGCECAPRQNSKKAEICCYLRQYHTGMGNAVFSRELERIFAIDGRNLRRKISALRLDGYPICSGDMGYSFADNQSEINATVGRLNELVTKVSNSRNGLLRSQAVPDIHVDITVHMSGGSMHAGD